MKSSYKVAIKKKTKQKIGAQKSKIIKAKKFMKYITFERVQKPEVGL